MTSPFLKRRDANAPPCLCYIAGLVIDNPAILRNSLPLGAVPELVLLEDPPEPPQVGLRGLPVSVEPVGPQDQLDPHCRHDSEDKKEPPPAPQVGDSLVDVPCDSCRIAVSLPPVLEFQVQLLGQDCPIYVYVDAHSRLLVHGCLIAPVGLVGVAPTRIR